MHYMLLRISADTYILGRSKTPQNSECTYITERCFIKGTIWTCKIGPEWFKLLYHIRGSSSVIARTLGYACLCPFIGFVSS